MRKKGVAIALGMLLSLSLLAGCANAGAPANGAGQVTPDAAQTTPDAQDASDVQITPDAEEAKMPADFKFHHAYEGEYETGKLEAYDEDGNLLWTYECTKQPAAQLDQINNIGANVNGYYLQDGPDIVCLAMTGEDAGKPVWKNSEFVGSVSDFCYGDSGEIYLTGYFGPDLMVIDGAGNTLYRYDAFASDEFYWACLISYDSESGYVTIRYENNNECLIVDPATGKVIERAMVDPAAMLIGKKDRWDQYSLMQFLNAEWAYTPEGSDNPTMYLYYSMDDNSFAVYRFDESADAEAAIYRGSLEFDYLEADETETPDLLKFTLTDAPEAESGLQSFGDYTIQSIEMDEDGRIFMHLLQVNNGDSVPSIYYKDYAPVFERYSLYGVTEGDGLEAVTLDQLVGEWQLSSGEIEGWFYTADEIGGEDTRVIIHENSTMDWLWKETNTTSEVKGIEIVTDPDGFLNAAWTEDFDSTSVASTCYFEVSDDILHIYKYNSFEGEEGNVWFGTFTRVL